MKNLFHLKGDTMQNAVSTNNQDLVASIAKNLQTINGFKTVIDNLAYNEYKNSDIYKVLEEEAAKAGHTAQCHFWDSVRARYEKEIPIRGTTVEIGDGLLVADWVIETQWAYTAYVRDRFKMSVPLWRVKKKGAELDTKDTILSDYQKKELAEILVQYDISNRNETIKRDKRRFPNEQ